MKISVIGAGNIGGLAAMRIAESRIGEVVLVDIAKGFAMGKAFDMEDARSIFKCGYSITGTDQIAAVEGSSIVVVTAGFARKPGMTREELLTKNAAVLKEICTSVRSLAPSAVVVVVTNPLDLMTAFVQSTTGFSHRKVLGMGVTLDASRFANLISKELKVPVENIEACVIGSHGEGMLPLPRFTTVNGIVLSELLPEDKINDLVAKTVGRGLEIVTLLGSGSAYFAPTAAIFQLVKAIAKDEKRILGVSTLLGGEYGISGVALGVPCRIGKNGVEDIITLELEAQEKQQLIQSASKLKEQLRSIIA